MKLLKHPWQVLSLRGHVSAASMTMLAIFLLGVLCAGSNAIAQETAFDGPILDRIEDNLDLDVPSDSDAPADEYDASGGEDSDDSDLSMPELEDSQTVYDGSIGVGDEFKIEGGAGTIGGEYTAGAEGSINVGENGIEAEATLGLAAELEAVSKQLEVGNEDVGGSIQASAKVEALLGAKAKVGAYIDENGITIGAQAKAGAFVSASAELNTDVHLFGLSATAKVYGEAHAGVLASGEAVVQIGFNGKIKFALGAGVSVGIGASAGVEVEVDASALIEKLGLPDLAELIEWLDAFVADPIGMIADIMVDEVIEIIDDAKTVITDFVERAWSDYWSFWAIPIAPKVYQPEVIENSEPSPRTPVDKKLIETGDSRNYEMPEMKDDIQNSPEFEKENLEKVETGSGEKWQLKKFPPDDE